MIFFQGLNNLDNYEKQRLRDWKANIELCDLIMSTPIDLNLFQLDQWILKNATDPNQYFKAVYRTLDNKLIGLARLMYIDKDSQIAEVGLYIGDIADRKGNYGSLILQHLIKVAFEEYQLNKIYARISKSNENSLRLFKKFDFITEGILREHHYSILNYKFNDVLILSIFNN